VAWHKIDYDGLWSSDKLSRCTDEAQADYAWVYGIADAWGCFELTNMRVVLGRVAPIRKKLSLERLESDFREYHANGLCFMWEVAGKRYGYWTGCELRLPPISVRSRYARSTPEPPKEQFEEYVRSFGGEVPQITELQPEGEQPAQPQPESQPIEGSLDVVKTGSRLDRDNGSGSETVTETEREPTHTPSRPAAEVRAPGTQPDEFQFEGEQPPQPQLESHRAENSHGEPNRRLLLEIYEQERGPLPAVRAETPERVSKCRRRLLSHTNGQEKFLADFRAAVRKASQIEWPAWRPSFDWFVANDTNLEKVLEGHYDQWRTTATHPGGNVNGRSNGKTPAAARSNADGLPYRKPSAFTGGKNAGAA
jgi:hypothetical protein